MSAEQWQADRKLAFLYAFLREETAIEFNHGRTEPRLPWQMTDDVRQILVALMPFVNFKALSGSAAPISPTTTHNAFAVCKYVLPGDKVSPVKDHITCLACLEALRKA